MAQLKNISIILKPKMSSDFDTILPNLIAWLIRRKKTIFFSRERKRAID